MTDVLISRLSTAGRVPDDIRHAAAQQRRFDAENTERSVGYVMLDCSGTTMDRYVDAPAIVFVEVFRKYGLEISMPEARARRWGCARTCTSRRSPKSPSVCGRFVAKFGREPNQADVDAMFADFVPTQTRPAAQGQLPRTAARCAPTSSRICSSRESRSA